MNESQNMKPLSQRRSIYTGRRIFPSDLILQRDDQVKIRGWHPLFTEDVTMSDTLKSAGYTTALISDIYHQFKPDKNFHRGFDSWRWIPIVQLMIWGSRIASGRLQVMLWLFWNSGMSCGGRLKFCGKLPVVQL